LVSSVRTKNMKRTKTARPTQKPITMESGGVQREVRDTHTQTHKRGRKKHILEMCWAPLLSCLVCVCVCVSLSLSLSLSLGKDAL